MKLYVDVDSEQMIRSPGVPQELDAISFKRTGQARIDVQFVRAGQIVELQSGTIGQFEIKPKGQYDAQPVSGANSWQKNGEADATYYSFFFSLITDELDALLHVNDNDADDLAQLVLMAEIQWNDGSEHKTQTLDFTILNNVIRTGDVIPPEAIAFDYIIDDSDEANPVVLIDEDSTQPLIVG